jgi:hypothetical protein
VALNIAGRGNRYMHTGKVVMGLFGKTGVVMYFGPDMFWQVA